MLLRVAITSIVYLNSCIWTVLIGTDHQKGSSQNICLNPCSVDYSHLPDPPNHSQLLNINIEMERK